MRLSDAWNSSSVCFQVRGTDCWVLWRNESEEVRDVRPLHRCLCSQPTTLRSLSPACAAPSDTAGSPAEPPSCIPSAWQERSTYSWIRVLCVRIAHEELIALPESRRRLRLPAGLRFNPSDSTDCVQGICHTVA